MNMHFPIEKQVKGSVISIPIRRGSLLEMTVASGSEWQYSVSRVKPKLYSITLCTLRDDVRFK